MREQPDSDEYDHHALNAMKDTISHYHSDARTVLDGEKERAGQNHYGELMLAFERTEEDVVARLYVNHLFRSTMFSQFREGVEGLVEEAVEPLGMESVALKEQDEQGVSGWCAFDVVETDR